jgi:WD40 repeat protein
MAALGMSFYSSSSSPAPRRISRSRSVSHPPHGFGRSCSAAVAVAIHTQIDDDAMGYGNLEIYYGEVRFWDLTRGKLMATRYTPTGDYLRTVACTAYRGRQVAVTGGDDRMLRMWDLARRKLVREWPVHGEIRSLSCGPDGTLTLAIGSDVMVVDMH